MTETTPPPPGFTAGRDGLQAGESARARVVSLIEFRAGDGPMVSIAPDYQVELERAPQSLVLSWQEDGHPMNAAIPVVVFDQFLQAGQIVIEA